MPEEEEGAPRILTWEGTVPVPPIPNTNYASFFLNVISQYGEQKALVDAETGKYHTYGDLCRLVPRVSAGLAAAGVVPGDSVMLLSNNHIDAPLVLLSIMLGGATCVPLGPHSSPEELCHVIQCSGARWVVAHEQAVKAAEEAFRLLGSSGTLKQMWVLGDASGRPSLADLIRTDFTQPPPVSEDFDSSKTVAMLPFSSGTTGLPKGVMLSHRNFLTAYLQNKYLRDIMTIEGLNVLESTLVIMPFYHIYGYTILINCLATGGQSIMLQRFTPQKYFEAIQTYKVTYSPIVPHIAKFLSETPLLEKYDLSSLMVFICGTSNLPSDTMTSLMEKSGKYLATGYGMTETCTGISANGGPFGSKDDSAGKILPYYECKIVDVETGQMLGEMKEGEVWLRGSSIMLGYAKNPKATSETIDTEGWLHTGDLGYYDEENFLFLTDRIKDLIKVKGFQVCPSELEKLLQSVEGVSEAAVVGVPSDRLGEAPRAFVVPAPGATLDPEALIKHVADHVVPYKQLAGGVQVVEYLPRNHLGKVLKKQLKTPSTCVKSKL